jgi:hypothetical protein
VGRLSPREFPDPFNRVELRAVGRHELQCVSDHRSPHHCQFLWRDSEHAPGEGGRIPGLISYGGRNEDKRRVADARHQELVLSRPREGKMTARHEGPHPVYTRLVGGRLIGQNRRPAVIDLDINEPSRAVDHGRITMPENITQSGNGGS